VRARPDEEGEATGVDDAQGRSVAPPPTAAKDASFVFAHDSVAVVALARDPKAIQSCDADYSVCCA
jgi:hypothetical protein